MTSFILLTYPSDLFYLLTFCFFLWHKDFLQHGFGIKSYYDARLLFAFTILRFSKVYKSIRCYVGYGGMIHFKWITLYINIRIAGKTVYVAQIENTIPAILLFTI